MVQRMGGARRKTRSSMRKGTRSKGKLNLPKLFTTYKDGERVVLTPESSVHSGIFHRRFIGRTGIVKGRQGKSYKVEVKDKNKTKLILVMGVHLRRV